MAGIRYTLLLFPRDYRAIEDIEQGRVYKYNSLDDLIKEIEG